MITKFKALMRLVAVILLIPIHLILCLFAAGLILVVLYFAGVALGWINTSIEPFEDGLTVLEMAFLLAQLAITLLLFGRVNGKWI